MMQKSLWPFYHWHKYCYYQRITETNLDMSSKINFFKNLLMSKSIPKFKKLFTEGKKIETILNLDHFGKRKQMRLKKESLDKIIHEARMNIVKERMERDKMQSLAIANLEKMIKTHQTQNCKKCIKLFNINSKTIKVMHKFFGVCFEIGKGIIYKSWNQWQNLPERIQGFIDNCNSFKAKLKLFSNRKIKGTSYYPLRKYLQLARMKMKISITKMFNTTMEGQIKQSVIIYIYIYISLNTLFLFI